MSRRLALAAAALWLAGCGESAEPDGRLVLRVVDAEGRSVTARVELLDAQGEAHVPPQALPLHFQCSFAPPPAWADFLVRSDRIENPHTGTEQFYLAGDAALDLPPGRYRLRAFRGPEHRVATRDLEVPAGGTLRVELPVERWIDMPARGWWSADDHVHLTRRTPEEQRTIGAWMRAEDLHVANLLQMGTVDQFGVTPQPGLGAAGEHRYGDTLLLAGQEHPRTHFLGHTITLAADEPIDRRETYVDYGTTARAALAANGLFGFAHLGIGPARDGLAVWAPAGLVSFVEVLQFEFAWYRAWYDLLDLGLRVTPTAGTDFPCGPWSVPGRERFYTRLDAPPTRTGWRLAVARGATFVTNGAMLELHVDDAGVGDTLALPGPGPVRLRAHVRFDPARQTITEVEIVRGGEPLVLPVARLAPGHLAIEVLHAVEAPTWFALRVRGDRLGEVPIPPGFPDWQLDIGDRLSNFREMLETQEAFHAGRDRVRPALAHTAAVFVRVAGRDLAEGEAAGARARATLARLDALAERLGDDRLSDQTLWDWIPNSDGVSEEHLRRNRPALLQAIESARERLQRLLPPDA